MNKLFVSLVLAGIGAQTFAAVSVDRVLVRQMWPWSRNVRVEYVLSGNEGYADLALEAYNGETRLDESAISAAIVEGEGLKSVAGNGTHCFVFDPAKAFGQDVKTYSNFRVGLTASEGDPLSDRVEYRIVDLETHEVTDLTRRDFYNHPEIYGSVTTDYSTIGNGFASSLGENETFVWTGVNENDDYKTKKLVLKRIPAKGKVWYMGPASTDANAMAADSWSHPYLGESRFAAKLTKDYFIGVFELTQAQYKLLTGETPSYFTNPKSWATRPVENVGKNPNEFVTAISSIHDFKFKIPTEAEWEFAAKAGYDGAGLPNGKALEAVNFAELEGYSSGRGFTQSDPAETGGTLLVGTGKPNAYGLYNTLGNVSEWTCDSAHKNLAVLYGNPTYENPKEDPSCSTWGVSVGYTVFRGGCWVWSNCRVAARYSDAWNAAKLRNTYSIYGYRLTMEAE